MSVKLKPGTCPECVLDDGWDYADPDNPQRCDHGKLAAAVGAAEERDRALAATADAHPNALRAAVRIITDTAARFETFSANTCRIEMEIAQIPGPVIGTAFGRCVRDGIIRRDGYTASSKSNTHGHPVAVWRSRIYRNGWENR